MTKFPDWEFQAELSLLSAYEFPFSHHGVNSSNLLGRSSPSGCSQRHSVFILGLSCCYLSSLSQLCVGGKSGCPRKGGLEDPWKQTCKSLGWESSPYSQSSLWTCSNSIWQFHGMCITGNWVEDKNKWADSGVELPLCGRPGLPRWDFLFSSSVSMLEGGIWCLSTQVFFTLIG